MEASGSSVTGRGRGYGSSPVRRERGGVPVSLPLWHAPPLPPPRRDIRGDIHDASGDIREVVEVEALPCACGGARILAHPEPADSATS
ncbi:unnamed protein product [Lampetra planeri]